MRSSQVEIPFQNVTIRDPFWSPRLEVNANRAIIHQWQQLEASGCIDNFRIAAKEKEGLRQGWFFADSDAYKWLEAAARVYATRPAPELDALIEGFIALLARAQQPAGYIFTYNQVHFPGMRWVNLQIEHELYCHGHLIEAGVSHYEAAGRTNLLDIARRAADRIVQDFFDAPPQFTSGHEEIEIALLRLSLATSEPSYLEMARRFLERRGRTPAFALSILRQNASVSARRKTVQQQRRDYLAAHPDYIPPQLPPENYAKKPPFVDLRWNLNALTGAYFQQHAPIRRQTVPAGHAVRFGYLQTAIAMLYRLAPDPTLLPVLEQSWERMVARRMYVTGGIGSLPALEGFGRDYELDPEYAYAETCAALSCMFWNWEMALITAEACYSDLFEWQLYNAAGPGMGLSGEAYLYNNPLACRHGVTRRPWFAVPCCPSNLSRTWASLGRYIFSATDDSLYVHQWIGCQADLPDGPCRLTLESGLPGSGRLILRLDPAHPAGFTVNLRIPSWAGQCRLTLNGESLPVPPASLPSGEPPASGYNPRTSRFLPVRRTWFPGDTLELVAEMPITLRRAHPRVKGHAGKVAVTRGPLVYCLESCDNPGIDLFTCHLEPSSLTAEPAPDLLGGCTVLRARTLTGQPLLFIPYGLWANRGESQMAVWINGS